MARPWDFGKITVRSGTPAVRDLEFLYEDGTPRTDLANANGYLRVYASGSTLLFSEVQLSASDASHKRVLSLTAAQCTQSKTEYYAEIEFRDDAGDVLPDSGWFGTLVLAGK